MRHLMRGRKLNRTKEHRRCLFANMATALVEHEQIKTTLPKAKDLRPIVEKYVTLAKRGDLHAYRMLISRLRSKEAAKKLVEELAPRMKDRNGGYLRILKAGFRYGDNAPMAVIEFVDRVVEEKAGDEEEVKAEDAKTEAAPKAEKKSDAKKAEAKKEAKPKAEKKPAAKADAKAKSDEKKEKAETKK